MKSVKRVQQDVQSHNATIKEKENQINSQTILISQLQKVQQDSQELLKVNLTKAYRNF